MNVYHIISKNDWENIRNEKYYTPESYNKEGFIHLSLLN